MRIATLQDVVAELITSSGLRREFEQDRAGFLAARGVDNPALAEQIDLAGLEQAARSTVRKRIERMDGRFPAFTAALQAKSRRTSLVPLLNVRFGVKRTEDLIASVRDQATALGDDCGECFVTLIGYDLARASLGAPAGTTPDGEDVVPGLIAAAQGRVRLADSCTVFASRVGLPSLIRQVDSPDRPCEPKDAEYLIVRGDDGRTALAELSPPLSHCARVLVDWTSVGEFVVAHGEAGRRFLRTLHLRRALEVEVGEKCG